jgi:hypothetical protein
MKAMAMNLMMKTVLVTSKQPWCELKSECSLRMNELVGFFNSSLEPGAVGD